MRVAQFPAPTKRTEETFIFSWRVVRMSADPGHPLQAQSKLLKLACIDGLGHMDIGVLFEGGLPACVIGITGNRHKGFRGKALETPIHGHVKVLSEAAWRMSCTSAATPYAGEHAWGTSLGIRVSRWV
ncbi:hypothetical protein [Paraburkholderia xenovorans]|uniref:hypothetical protein n=1 Tax=Paraburkholderia xenovorans TaxID=36873 RepID=UPI0038BDA8B7